jgi:hypothetical protein
VKVDDLRLGRVCFVCYLLQQQGSRILGQGVGARVDAAGEMVDSAGGNIKNISLERFISM